MWHDGFITHPTFRPDGRLDALNFGGGKNAPKQAGLKKFSKAFEDDAQEKGKPLAKDWSMKDFLQVAKQQKVAAQAKAATPVQPQQKQQQAPGAMAAGHGMGMGGTKAQQLKRKTLLAGDAKSQEPLGSNTILGG